VKEFEFMAIAIWVSRYEEWL